MFRQRAPAELRLPSRSEAKRRAPSGVGPGPQPATMRLNNGKAVRQAYAGALWFGRLTEEMLSN
jgi:hypothetical protein